MTKKSSPGGHSNNETILKTVLHLLLLIIVGVLLAACNSGGGSDSSDNGDDNNINNPPDEQQRSTLEDPPSTNGQIQVITDNQNLAATSSTPTVVYNSAGNGIAVWTVQTGNGSKILASYYDATTDMWSAEQTVVADSYPVLGSSRLQLADSQFMAGTDAKFIMAWVSDDNMYTGEFDIANQSWTINVLISNQTARPSIPRITSDGADFLVVWQDRLTDSVKSKRYINGAWQNDETILQIWDATIDLHYSISPDVLLASIDNLSIAFWYVITNNTSNNANTYTLYASVLDSNAITSEWSVPVALNAQGVNGNIYPYEIKTGTSQILLSWAQKNSQADDSLFIYSKTFDTAISEWSNTVQVNDTALNYPYSPVFSATIGDAGFGYTWIDEGTDITDSISTTLIRLYVNANDTGWLPVTPLSTDSVFAYQPSIGANDLGFAVQWFESSAQDGRLRYINRFLNGNWQIQATEFSMSGNYNPFQQAIIGHKDSFYAIHAVDAPAIKETTLLMQSVSAEDNWTDTAAISSWTYNTYSRSQTGNLHIIPTTDSISISWAQFAELNGDSRIYPFIADLSAATVEANNLASNTISASGISSLLTTNSIGHTLAFAVQYDNGLYQRYASIRKAGEWRPPIQLDQESRAIQSQYPIFRFIAENAVATNDTQFCAIWDNGLAIYGRIYDGETWEAEEQLLSDAHNPGDLKLVAHQQGFLAVWEAFNRTSNIRSIQSAYYDNGVWTVEPIAEISGDDRTAPDNSHIALDAATTDEFMLAWIEEAVDGSKSVMALFHNDAQIVTTYPVMQSISSDAKIEALKVTALSAGNYLVSYINSNTSTTSTDDSLEIYRFTPQQQTAWNNIYNEHQSSIYYALESADQFVALTFVDGLDVYGRSYSITQASWTQPELLDSNLDGSVYALNIAGNGNQVAVTWDGRGNSQAKYSIFDGVTWSDPIALSDQPDTLVRRNPYISRYRNNFGITWSETNLSTDSSLSYIAAQMGEIQ